MKTQGSELAHLTDSLGNAVSRRRALRTLAVASASLAGVLVGSKTALADPGPGTKLTIDVPDPKISTLRAELCGIYCYPVDCCCCDPPTRPNLVRCEDDCAGTYFYACASECSFCYSQAC